MLCEFFEKHGIKPQKIAVGVSGGADSLFAVLKAHEELTSLGFQVIALTVDHGLRPSSRQEALFVADLMQKNGIEHHILCWEGTKPTQGVEEAARNARYALIEEWCAKHGVCYVMTAHHLYDQVETFFMRLKRGSGLDGLCGMREITPLKSVRVLRPFLETDPHTFKTFLRKHDITWVEDESNEDESLLRVQIRHFLPFFVKQTGISAEQVGQTMKRLQSSRAYFENKIQNLIKTHFRIYKDKVFCCSCEFFDVLETEIQYRLACYLIKFISQTDYAPESEKIFTLLQKMAQENFKSGTLGHCRVIDDGNFIWFLPEIRSEMAYTKKIWREYVSTHKELKKMKFPAAVKRFFVNH